VADAGAFDAGREVVADLALVGAGELMAEEGGDMLGLDHVHGGAHDSLVERLELRLAAEDHVGGEFRLHEAPVVAGAKMRQYRAEALCPPVEVLVKRLGIETVGQALRLLPVADVDKGVVGHREGDVGGAQLARQPGMAVAVDLQAKRRPRGHAYVAQAELLVDEVEVVVKTPAGVRLEQRAPAGLVVPWPIRGARLHGREDMHQAGVLAALGENLRDAVLLAERLEMTDKLDLHAGLGREALGVGPQLLTQRRGPQGIVEQLDVAVAEEAGHRLGVTDVR